MNNKDSLGDRMKRNYENISRTHLTRRTPVIVRLDGKAFHTLTKNIDKPFDEAFMEAMAQSAKPLFNFIGGNLKLAYVQSDEISLLLTDWDRLTSEAFFDYNIQKLVSTIASKVSVEFTKKWGEDGIFDARAFNIPREEVANYFIWRQQDWERNSIQMLAQAHYSHSELHGKNMGDIHEMLYKVDVNWSLLSRKLKRGVCILPGNQRPEDDGDFSGAYVDKEIPIFKEDRNYLEWRLNGYE